VNRSPRAALFSFRARARVDSTTGMRTVFRFRVTGRRRTPAEPANETLPPGERAGKRAGCCAGR
jgi:hypothetical protein